MVEVTEETFEAETIRRSVKHPVVVELYSPRVASGQQLSDALIEIANSSGGKFLLARLNVDARARHRAGAGAAGRADGDRPDRRPGRPAVPGRAGQGAGSGGDRPAAQGGGGQRHRRPGRAGRRTPASADSPGDEPEPDPRFAAADEALARGDFAAAEAEFDKLLAANPGDAEAQAGKAQAALFARATRYDPQIVLAAARADDGVGVQLDAADVEMVSGQVEAAFDRLIGLIRTKAGDERNQVRVRLLELFETVGNADPRVLKARRDLMTALF